MRIISSVVRVTSGIIIAPSAMPPASAVNLPIGFTRNCQAKMPITIDGSPLRTSDRNRTAFARCVPRFSARYSPAPMPIGRPKPDAARIRTSVPTIALAMPPPSSPGGLGICVKNATLSDDAPTRTRCPRMKISGSVAATAARNVTPTMTTLTTRRRVSVVFVRSAAARWTPDGRLPRDAGLFGGGDVRGGIGVAISAPRGTRATRASGPARSR